MKQKKEVNDLGNITNTVYAGNYIYENDVLKFFSHPEGYLEPNGFGFDYVYQYKDHLGNIRLSYKNPLNSYENILESDLTNSMDGWVPNGQVGTELINGSLKVNIDSAYEGIRHDLSHLTVSNGDVLNIRLTFDKGNTQSKVRLYFEELDSNGILVGWDFLSTDLQTGVFEYTYTVTTANKLKLRIAKDNTNTNTPTHFYVDYVSVTSGALEIVEENNYYPFGLKHKGYNNVSTSSNIALNYKFGGMEYNEELGLEWYDISARNYDPALGRWMNIDPLAEAMRRHSPYNYAFDNPIFFMDPDGMSPIGTLASGGSINALDVQNSAFGGNQISSASVTVSGTGTGSSAGGSVASTNAGNNSSNSDDSNRQEPLPSNLTQSNSSFDKEDCCGGTNSSLSPNSGNAGLEAAGLRALRGNSSDNEISDESTSGLSWRTPVGAGLVGSGMPLLSKRFMTKAFGNAPAASVGTSIASKFFSKVLPFKSPVRLPTISGGVTSGLRWTYTKNIGRFAGRWTPFIGWGLLAYDAGAFFNQAVLEIKSGSLIDGRYNNTPGTKWAKRYGEREQP